MLNLTIGISGAGKSTFARDYCAKNGVIYLSSDVLRSVIGKSEEDQSVNAEVFFHLRRDVAYFLKIGNEVLVDATNLTKANREHFLKIARERGAQTRGWIFECPLEVALARNAARSRKVPEDVIKRQFSQLEVPVTGEFHFDYYMRINPL